MPEQVQKKAWVYGPRAARHHESLQRCEAHGGIDGPPLENSRDGATRAQVAHHQAARQHPE